MSPLEQVQSDIASKLLAEPYTARFTVFVLRESRTSSEVDQALSGIAVKNGLTGITVTVMMPLVNVDKPNAPGPATVGNVSILILESPDINMGPQGFNVPAEELAMVIGQMFHHFHLVGIANPFYPATPLITPAPEYLPLIGYKATWNFLMPLGKLLKLQVPTIAPSTGPLGTVVTISHGTPGVAIYYTTDGSLPIPPVPDPQPAGVGFIPSAAKLYVGPVPINESPLRAAAYLEGYVGSDANFAEYA